MVAVVAFSLVEKKDILTGCSDYAPSLPNNNGQLNRAVQKKDSRKCGRRNSDVPVEWLSITYRDHRDSLNHRRVWLASQTLGLCGMGPLGSPEGEKRASDRGREKAAGPSNDRVLERVARHHWPSCSVHSSIQLAVLQLAVTVECSFSLYLFSFYLAHHWSHRCCCCCCCLCNPNFLSVCIFFDYYYFWLFSVPSNLLAHLSGSLFLSALLIKCKLSACGPNSSLPNSPPELSSCRLFY